MREKIPGVHIMLKDRSMFLVVQTARNPLGPIASAHIAGFMLAVR